MKAIKNRIKVLWWLLTKRNFIVIIPKETATNGEPSREIQFVVRTDYTLHSDLLSVAAVHQSIHRAILQKAAHDFIYTKPEPDEVHN